MLLGRLSVGCGDDGNKALGSLHFSQVPRESRSFERVEQLWGELQVERFPQGLLGSGLVLLGQLDARHVVKENGACLGPEGEFQVTFRLVEVLLL